MKEEENSRVPASDAMTRVASAVAATRVTAKRLVGETVNNSEDVDDLQEDEEEGGSEQVRTYQ